MNSLVLILIICIIIVVVYSSCQTSIQQFMNKNANWTLTYYYSPTCPHCVSFTDKWSKVKKRAGSLGILTKEVNILQVPGMTRVPTLILSDKNGLDIKYQDDRNIEDIVEWMKFVSK